LPHLGYNTKESPPAFLTNHHDGDLITRLAVARIIIIIIIIIIINIPPSACYCSRWCSTMKYVAVVGGMVSGLGKGITISSLGRLLISAGLRVTSIKIDPYLNIDAGTMSPFEHGEVFVLDDGGEVRGTKSEWLQVILFIAMYETIRMIIDDKHGCFIEFNFRQHMI